MNLVNSLQLKYNVPLFYNAILEVISSVKRCVVIFLLGYYCLIKRIRHQTVCLGRLFTSLRIFLRAFRLIISTALAIFQRKLCPRLTLFLFFLSYFCIYFVYVTYIIVYFAQWFTIIFVLHTLICTSFYLLFAYVEIFLIISVILLIFK